VVQKAINNLKEGPKEDKVVVAGGIAITVVVILLVVWAFLFLRSIRNNSEQLNLGGGAQEDFYFSNTKEAQAQLQGQFDNTDELEDIRQRSASGEAGAEFQTVGQETQGSGTDQFGSSQ
jgi:hypothetical protein